MIISLTKHIGGETFWSQNEEINLKKDNFPTESENMCTYEVIHFINIKWAD